MSRGYNDAELLALGRIMDVIDEEMRQRPQAESMLTDMGIAVWHEVFQRGYTPSTLLEAIEKARAKA